MVLRSAINFDANDVASLVCFRLNEVRHACHQCAEVSVFLNTISDFVFDLSKPVSVVSAQRLMQFELLDALHELSANILREKVCARELNICDCDFDVLV